MLKCTTGNQEELEEELLRIKLRKACGDDELASEMITWIGEKGEEWLWNVLKEL